jgi:hypothetical protein
MDRLEPANSKLIAIASRDFEADRDAAIARFNALSPEEIAELKKWSLDDLYGNQRKSAFRTAEQRKTDAKQYVYRYYRSHCAICEAPLTDKVYLIDKISQGRVYDRLPSCEEHAKPRFIGRYKNGFSTCSVCRVLFQSPRRASVCSNACMGLKHRIKAKPEERACLVCDALFTPKRSDAQTCGIKCRVAKSRKAK